MHTFSDSMTTVEQPLRHRQHVNYGQVHRQLLNMSDPLGGVIATFMASRASGTTLRNV